MSEGQNLPEKISDDGINLRVRKSEWNLFVKRFLTKGAINSGYAIWEWDVEEFIRRLKEEFKPTRDYSMYLIKKRINKLAGEKLIVPQTSVNAEGVDSQGKIDVDEGASTLSASPDDDICEWCGFTKNWLCSGECKKPKDDK